MHGPIQSAVADAVNLVNRHSGKTTIHLRFVDTGEIDIIANAATFTDGAFEFQAGFETVGGSIDELLSIQAEVIPS